MHRARLLNTIFCIATTLIPVVGCGSKSSTTESSSGKPDNSQSLVQSALPKNPSSPSLEPATSEMADALFGDDPLPALPRTAVEQIPAIPESALRLRPNLTPERLTEFLQLSDLEMQRIASGKAGILDQAKANQEMIRVGKLKLQAATQLQASESADAKQKALGVRGQLQSLSHLAALGDVKSAEQLESLATNLVNSDDVNIVEDSRLVLIGLALERIQNGSAKDATGVMAQVEKLGQDGRTPNIAAMMVMGQARAVLEKYGFTSESTLIRNRIVGLFAAHSDPNVAAMALDIAGTPRFADVDRLLRSLEKGDTVSLAAWRNTVNELLAESPDLSAVQFLAGAALQAEASGHEDIATATYVSLQSSISLGEREQREVKLASVARKARQSIIGQKFDLDLPSTDGRPLSLSSFSGRVVLMPFWAIHYPESLSLLQLLGEIRDQSAGKVEIVGMNLDTADAPLDEFMAKSPVLFRSFQCVTNPGAKNTNEAATKFGVVSMPFVAIIGPNGKVAGINFTGHRLQETVDQLLKEQAP